jgi:hypothetical protein
MTPSPCGGAERNMGLSPPLLLSGSRTGMGRIPLSVPSPLLPAPCSLASCSSGTEGVPRSTCTQVSGGSNSRE